MSSFPQHSCLSGLRRNITFHYFWCNNCRRTVRLLASNRSGTLCPFCAFTLHHEPEISLPWIGSGNQFVPGMEPSPAARAVEAMATAIVGNSVRGRGNGDDFGNNFGRGRMTRWEFDLETTHRPRINLNFAQPPPSRPAPPIETRQRQFGELDPETSHRPRINLNFTQPPPSRPAPPPPIEIQQRQFTEDEVMDRLFHDTVTENGSPWPPPAPAAPSAIESLKKLKITDSHLASDPICPVCKDEFDLNGEATELPCNHIYHSDCILPWLRLNSTCPVCRFELKSDNDPSISEEMDYGRIDFSIEDVGNGLDWVRRRFLSLRPVRIVSDWTRLYFDFLDSRMSNAASSLEGRARWPSWLIL